jgi:hypothetical protein
MHGIYAVAVRFERRLRCVELLRRPAQVARDERDLGLGNDAPRAGHRLSRTERAPSTSQESLCSNEIAELPIAMPRSASAWHGHNAFIRDGERVFRTYFINSRGDEAMGTTWSYLDMTALGRQETWEDSPEGYPQSRPYKWWNWHESYVPDAAPDPKWVEVSDAGEAAFRKRDAGAKA